MRNDSTRRLLNDFRNDGERGGFRVILSIDKDGVFRTFGPFLKGSVDCLLHVGAVEINICSSGQVFETSWISENIIQKWTSCCYLVHVKAWVDERDGVKDGGPEVALGSGRGKGREFTLWRIDEVVPHVIGVAALVSRVVNLFAESLVEWEEALPVINERDGGD